MAEIHCLTGPIRAGSSAIFVFIGPAERTVEWRMPVGSGALFPFATYTDSVGQAACRYESGGYEGPLTIQVAYVP